MRKFKRQRGVTLIELLVTLSILAILLAIAAPSFMTVIQDNRRATQLNDFVTALNYARSEAVKRGDQVSVCRSANGTACAAAGGWDQGYIVFTDTNNNRTVNAGVDTVLRVFEALTGGNTLTSTRFSITFAANSFSMNYNGTWTLCDSRGAGAARAVVLSNQGRVRTDTVDVNGNALVCP
jgi:type IV fimbrial biogenesis protein FimT